MQKQDRWRLAASIAPPLMILSVAAIVACRDVVQPQNRTDDEWAEQTLVRVAVHSTLTTLTPSGFRQTTLPTHTASLPTLRAVDDSRAQMDISGSATEVRHVKVKDGRTFSLARLSQGAGKPPKRHYFFENGRIRAVVSYKYVRQGKYWLQSSARLSLFDEKSQPVAQIESVTDGKSADKTAMDYRSFAADAIAAAGKLVLPTELHAQDIPISCDSEWFAVAAASLILAEVMAELTAEAVLCSNPSTAALACPTIPAGVVKVLGAMGALTLTWDALAACRNKRALALGGGEIQSGTVTDIDEAAYRKLTDTVTKFIEDSISTGNFQCTLDLSYCIYYGND
jgi:hypothetical protein